MQPKRQVNSPYQRQRVVSFKISATDRNIIQHIGARAFTLAKQYGHTRAAHDYVMDVTAVHANGNPLRLAELIAADEFNFIHDIFGIQRHLNRNTGTLENCFRPRFSQPSR